MNAFTCDTVRSHLPLFSGGDLDVADAESVRAHLIVCVACRNEASGLQRALAGLRTFGSPRVPGVDEAWFAAQQRAICARVEATPPPVARGGAWRAWGLAAAALLLIALGFALGQSGRVSNVFTRGATPIGFDDLKAVPWSGLRAPMRQLGADESDDESDDGRGGVRAAGMRGREELRTLVDDGLQLPPRKRVPR